MFKLYKIKRTKAKDNIRIRTHIWTSKCVGYLLRHGHSNKLLLLNYIEFAPDKDFCQIPTNEYSVKCLT